VDERALRTPAHGARDVRDRRRPRPAGQDELLQRTQIGVEALYRGLEARDVGVADRDVAGIDNSPPRSKRSCWTL
jgi:hypothetical protein